MSPTSMSPEIADQEKRVLENLIIYSEENDCNWDL